MSLPVFRISVHNATLLSAFYLLVATLFETIRRVFIARWAEQACLAMEAFPARALDLLGLLEPLKRWYAWGEISEVEVRLIFGATTVVLIFVLAALVGTAMWTFARYVTRHEELG